jgi:phosphatidate cytidylyltransferase
MASDNKSKLIFYWYKIINFLEKIDPSSNLKKRFLMAFVLIPIAVIAIFFAPNLFLFLTLGIAFLMTYEWVAITKNAKDQQKWLCLGFCYVVIPLFSVLKIYHFKSCPLAENSSSTSGASIIFWMFSIIWATDIFAFFAGKYFGGPKIAPSISPNKTWAGLFGGVVASCLIGGISGLMFPGNMLFFIVISGFLSILEQVSDFLESKIKRMFGVKDSSHIIPGHGGVLDRLDGLTLVAPMVWFLTGTFAKQFGIAIC